MQWDPPVYPNGILTNYDVIVFNRLTEFNFSGQINVSDAREMLVTELGKCYSWYHVHALTITCLMLCIDYSEPFVAYTVQVVASTEVGRGKVYKSLVFTKHGGKN